MKSVINISKKTLALINYIYYQAKTNVLLKSIYVSLKLLAGLEKPTGGEIIIGGTPHRGPGLEKAVVFQDYGLYPWMSAGANIDLAIKQRYPRKSKSELKDITVDMFNKVGLGENVYNKLPKELSGGMKQRCAIARAFAIDSPILLMDEPFGALDAITRVKLQDLVLDLWSQKDIKKTVFFVTHDVDEALFLAERIIVLGQQGSGVIYDYVVKSEQRASRDEKDSKDYIELRNKLVQKINEDITKRAEPRDMERVKNE